MKAVTTLTLMVLFGLGLQVKAQPPCAEMIRLRNEANAAWKEAMRAPASARCATLSHASLATEATLRYATENRHSCDISDRILSEVEGYHRGVVRARDNVCAGRPLRPYPPEIIQH